MFTLNNTLHELYQHPLGHDIINKLLLSMNISPKVMKISWLNRLKLETLIDKSFIEESVLKTLLNLVNQTSDLPQIDDNPIVKKWWKEAVFYQIYPRSFKDSNGDGIGDIKGIITKLDYLKELGVDCLWLSPINQSPNADNGYDISDYKAIASDMGSMEDFVELVDKVHEKGMKIIMDLVVNHTSDQHPWYQQALLGDEKYMNYYHLIESDIIPNNWTSFFSGSVWKYEPSIQKWMLHLFTEKQPDLNWENPVVRREVSEIANFYCGLGVDGFRLDVINYISKASNLPMGDEEIGKLIGFTGIEHYFYGPHLHEYLHELRMNSFEKNQSFSIGETPGIGIETSKLFTQPHRKELDLIFSFDHLETRGHARFDNYQYDLNYLKQYYINYQNRLNNNDWMSLYVDNHDNPKMASKVNLNSKHYDRLCMLLNGMLLTLKGTPFLYQGQELGTKNQPFTSIEQFKDIESINKYHELIKKKSRILCVILFQVVVIMDVFV